MYFNLAFVYQVDCTIFDTVRDENGKLMAMVEGFNRIKAVVSQSSAPYSSRLGMRIER